MFILSLYRHPFIYILFSSRFTSYNEFRFIGVVCFANLKGSIVLMLGKVSVMRVTIPLDLSTRSFIPLPRFIHTRTTSPLFYSVA